MVAIFVPLVGHPRSELDPLVATFFQCAILLLLLPAGFARHDRSTNTLSCCHISAVPATRPSCCLHNPQLHKRQAWHRAAHVALVTKAKRRPGRWVCRYAWYKRGSEQLTLHWAGSSRRRARRWACRSACTWAPRSGSCQRPLATCCGGRTGAPSPVPLHNLDLLLCAVPRLSVARCGGRTGAPFVARILA